MWTRFLIECHTCLKTTNLRIQIPEEREMNISFYCMECNSEIKGIFKVKMDDEGWGIDLERGKIVDGNLVTDGDYFVEFSDTLSVSKPSKTPHDKIVPTLRKSTQEFLKAKETKDLRKFHTKEEWNDFKDLCRAYVPYNKKVLETLSYRILERIYPLEIFEIKIDLDYQRNFFLCLNYFIYPWIDFDNQKAFISWTSNNIFKPSDFKNPELNELTEKVLNRKRVDKIRADVCDIVIRFEELRHLFFFAIDNKSKSHDSHVPIENFTKLKNFYTDCFEFIGRESELIFRLQNLKERGNQNSIPSGVPRNVVDAISFSKIDNGSKLDIICLSTDPEPKEVYINCFNSRLRNGINHNKCKIDPKTQIISYFPITKRPEEEYQIEYIEFLKLSLDSFNSVLKIGQIIKMRNNYIYFKNEKNCL